MSKEARIRELQGKIVELCERVARIFGENYEEVLWN